MSPPWPHLERVHKAALTARDCVGILSPKPSAQHTASAAPPSLGTSATEQRSRASSARVVRE
eukprot:8253873-Pyramimonas_sp.AAC.1